MHAMVSSGENDEVFAAEVNWEKQTEHGCTLDIEFMDLEAASSNKRQITASSNHSTKQTGLGNKFAELQYGKSMGLTRKHIRRIKYKGNL